MKREQNVQALTLSKNGKQTEQLTPVDTAQSDKLKKKNSICVQIGQVFSHQLKQMNSTRLIRKED